MTSRKLPDALDYALGGAEPAARRALSVDAAMDADFAALVESLEAKFGPLAAPVPAIAPPPGLWARIEAELEAADQAFAPMRTERAGEGEWRPIHPGVEIKTLWNGQSFMLRCAPGAVIPPHPHLAHEAILVVAGDMIVGGDMFGPGDYHVHAAETEHAPTTTRGGCLLLLQYAA